MKKDLFKIFQPKYDTPEEKAQAEKEELYFKRMMGCSLILIGVITLIIVLIFVYLTFN